ncbi:Hypothetical predicted protein, partial [Paramuricea clavata]
EFLNEAFNFESKQPTNSISSNNAKDHHQPPLKKQNCVTENRSPSLGSDQLYNSTGITRNNASEHIIVQELLRRSPATNSFTPNIYNERDASQNLLRSTISPSVSKQSHHLRGTVSKQTPEFRIANDSSNHLRGTGSNTKQIYSQRLIKSPVQRNLRTPTTERRCFTPRRFPGPAGILPRLDPGQSLDNLQSPSLETPTKKSPQLCQLVTGDSDEDFAIEPWTLMQEKISKDFPDSLDCLSSVITKAASHQLERGKVAFLPVLVKSFRPTGLDVSIVLKDPSGEMRGTLHRKVLEQQEIEIGPGCGLFLKQVSVFSPSPRKHYLNITPGNILEIFPASAERCGSRKIAEATPKSGPKVMQKQAVCSNSNKEIEQAHSFEETNFDELLEGLDDDDDILVEAMNC